MATRYVWRKQDLAYSESTSSAQRVYVGDSDIYAAASYSFDVNTGLYTLTNPTKIQVKSLSDKTNYKYFIVGSPSGTVIYDNTSHTLPANETVDVSNSYYGGIQEWWF